MIKSLIYVFSSFVGRLYKASSLVIKHNSWLKQPKQTRESISSKLVVVVQIMSKTSLHFNRRLA